MFGGVNGSVDFGVKTHQLVVGSAATTVSTYGQPITTDATARAVYQRIAKDSIVRIALQWNGGRPISSATGGARDVTADAWIAAIEQMGAKVMIVVGGSKGNNFTVADAVNLVRRYHPYAVVVGNEAGGDGMSIEDYTSNLFIPTATAIRAADPNVLIAGPGWAWYDGTALRYFISHVGSLLDILDYHDYGTGTNSPDDASLMAITSRYEADVNQAKAWLAAANLPNVQVQVGEFNLAWQFTDGRSDYLGGDGRFYSAFNTAWSASVIGHALSAGARVIAYSQQNGPLGLMIEPGNNDAGQLDGTPMPIYHAIAAFQGGGLHAGMGDSLVGTTLVGTNLECYAGITGTIVLINKTNTPQTVHLAIKGARDGVKTVWSTQPTRPMAYPQVGQSTQVGGQMNFTLAGYQVLTIAAK
jgi:hypothetical protein